MFLTKRATTRFSVRTATHRHSHRITSWWSSTLNSLLHCSILFTVTKECLWQTEEDATPERYLLLDACLRNSTLGHIWQRAMPFLTPFIAQYCVVAIVVLYVVWDSYHSVCSRQGNSRKTSNSLPRYPSQRNFAADKLDMSFSHAAIPSEGCSQSYTVSSYPARVSSGGSYDTLRNRNRNADCQGGSRGLFLGLLVLASGKISEIRLGRVRKRVDSKITHDLNKVDPQSDSLQVSLS